MSVLIALPAAGAVLVSMILSVSAPRLCTLLATSATKALNLLKLAMQSSCRLWVGYCANGLWPGGTNSTVGVHPEIFSRPARIRHVVLTIGREPGTGQRCTDSRRW